MKVLDAIKLGVEAYANARKGDLTEEQLNVALATDTLEDGTVLEYESLAEGFEVFVIVEGEDPKVATDKEYTLSDGQMIVVLDGKISEIKPKEEEAAEEDVELSEEQKHIIELATKIGAEDLEKLVNMKDDAWYTIEFSVVDGRICWADMYTNKFDVILSEQVDPIKVELEAEKTKVTDLEAKIVLLQELNDNKNPLKKDVKLEDDKPKTAYEIQLGL